MLVNQRCARRATARINSLRTVPPTVPDRNLACPPMAGPQSPPTLAHAKGRKDHPSIPAPRL